MSSLLNDFHNERAITKLVLRDIKGLSESDNPAKDFHYAQQNLMAFYLSVRGRGQFPRYIGLIQNLDEKSYKEFSKVRGVAA